jgi:ergothioneine biosynthesis protein EgtB
MTEASALTQQFTQCREHSLRLIENLSAEDCQLQATADVSPLKWHLAHTTWFFETFVLKPFVKGYQPNHPEYETLFNSYYDGIGEQFPRAQRGLLSRPTLKQVLAYRQCIDAEMLKLLQSLPDANATDNDDALSAPELIDTDKPGAELTDSEASTTETTATEINNTVVLGLNHEQQHQELMLMDTLYNFSVNPLHPVFNQDFSIAEANTKNEWLNMSRGQYQIGATEGFCFDNELPRHTVTLTDFSIASRLVTNGEFLKFIEDGGYQDYQYWHSDGFAWVKDATITTPLYWQKHKGSWHEFTMAGLQPLNKNAPVRHISFYEAFAFAQYSQARLPTEFEWECAALQHEPIMQQLSEHVWQWTQSSYQPYPGFTPFAGNAGEYNGKFMVNQQVLRGGSILTPVGHSRRSYRNFFYPHQRWVCAGIRLAKDV